MTKRTRTQQDQNQWQAQRDERMSTLMQQLEAGVEAIQTSEDFKRYLRTAAIFHAYSPNNVLLILSQRPDATRVAGYKTWQALGRQVKKGEKAIMAVAHRLLIAVYTAFGSTSLSLSCHRLRALWLLCSPLPLPMGRHIVAVRTLFTAVAPGMVAGCIDEDIRTWRRVADLEPLDTVLFERRTQTERRFGCQAAG